MATLHPCFRNPGFRPYRVVVYASLGLSAVIFILHGLLLHGWRVQNHRMSLEWMFLMACLNLMGGVIYAARVSSSSQHTSFYLLRLDSRETLSYYP